MYQQVSYHICQIPSCILLLIIFIVVNNLLIILFLLLMILTAKAKRQFLYGLRLKFFLIVGLLLLILRLGLLVISLLGSIVIIEIYCRAEQIYLGQWLVYTTILFFLKKVLGHCLILLILIVFKNIVRINLVGRVIIS